MSDFDLANDLELVAEFVDESDEMLNHAANLLIVLEKNPRSSDAQDAIFRTLHTIKGNSAFFDLLRVKALSHIMEDIMNLLRQGDFTHTSDIIDPLILGIDYLRSMLRRARVGQPEVDDETAYRSLFDTFKRTVDSAKNQDISSLWHTLADDAISLRSSFQSDETAERTLLDRIVEAIAILSPHAQGTRVSPTAGDVVLPKGEVHASLEPSNSPKLENAPEASDATAQLATGKTMRISESSIDQFLDYVGELVMVGEMYDHVEKRFSEEVGMSKAIIALRRTNDTFHALSRNLQCSILEVRKVPVKTLLQKAPRIIRDIATVRGQSIRVVTAGDELTIDKSLLEALDGPLTHLLRNAADHGIESVDVRRQRGKPDEGTVRVDVRQTEDEMFLEVSDDGNGIDREAVKAKAIRTGVISAAASSRLSDSEIYRLLFLPGFSTAKVVTDVSGRGVGMDVVKRNIETIGGRILIESTSGRGTCFTIQFPKSVTLRIIQGLLVAVCGERFVLPMSSVGESFAIKPDGIVVLPGAREGVMHHDRLFPVVRLSSTLGYSQTYRRDGTTDIGIVLSTGSKAVVAIVNEVLGSQQVVVKEVEGLASGSDLILGAAIMGDGKVVIVLDPEKLCG